MKLEIFCICDAANDSHGKLNILGVLDTIVSARFPVLHPHLAVVVRIRFTGSDRPKHNLTLKLTHQDRADPLTRLQIELVPRLATDQEYTIAQAIFNLEMLNFDSEGEYLAQLEIDEQALGSTPLYVKAK